MNYELWVARRGKRGFIYGSFHGKIPELILLVLCLDGSFNKPLLLVALKSQVFLLLNVPNWTVETSPPCKLLWLVTGKEPALTLKSPLWLR